MDLVTLAFAVLLPLVPWVSLWFIVRHGPFRHRWWAGETVAGFALTVGGACFAAGFFGPILLAPEANQGPLLGIFITGPVGLVLGLAWGAWRALQRRRAGEGATSG
jgi:hypothetical protein